MTDTRPKHGVKMLQSRSLRKICERPSGERLNFDENRRFGDTMSLLR
jgi:hypothetical protein